MNPATKRLTMGCAVAVALVRCTPAPPSNPAGSKPSAPSPVVSALPQLGEPATPPSALPAASAPAASAGPAASVAPATSARSGAPGTCDNERVEKPVDCSVMPQLLGECGAMAHYSCPQQEKRRPGTSFRAGTAARIGNCYVAAGQPQQSSCKTWEACVRSGIAESCAQEEDRAWCKKNLPACDSNHQELCAKILSSMEPSLHDEAIRNIRDLNGAKLKKTCQLTWDFNGFPFCPFCDFGR